MEFKTGYWHSLDKQSERNINVPPSKMGIPTHPAKDQLQGLKGRIMLGAQNVELGFMGRGKGSMQQGNTTPGMYGKDERQAMKELAKVNKVNLSVHASPAITGFAGFTGRGFDDHERKKNMDEVRRAIDFAADTTEGGAVVMHVGEFPRPLTEIPGDKGKLEYYPEEEKKAVLYLVDQHTGEMIGGLRRDHVVKVPMKKPDGSIELVRTKEGLLQPKMREMKFSDFESQANKNRLAGIKGGESDPAYLMYKATLDERKEDDLAWTRQHSHALNEAKEKIEVITKYLAEEKDLGKIEELKKMRDQQIHSMEYHRGVASSHMQRVENINQQLERTVPLADYAKQRSFDSLAKLGIDAMNTTKERKLKNPIFIAPENIWAETGYGSHPDELKDIITESRKKMADKLVKDKNMSRGRAEDMASKHIRATFDIGHANTWKKHFKMKPGETMEKHDKRFKKWLMGKVDDMNKAGVIGHVHMSDNFGYEDEHGTLGEGTAPAKDFLEKMEKSGYKGTMIAEPAHNDYRALLGAWRSLESPMYKIDHTSRSWTDIEHGYFGRTFSPNYVIQSYLPVGGEKQSLTWSEIPLE